MIGTFYPAPIVVPKATMKGWGFNTFVSAKVAEGVAYSTAVMAQEVNEREQKRKTLAIGLAGGVLIGTLLVALGLPFSALPCAAVVGLMGGGFLTKTDRYRRHMEILGHAVDVEAARVFYGAEPEWYRGHEAQGMTTGYSFFRGWTADQISAAMVASAREAAAWVERHRDTLQAWKDANG